MSPVPCLSLYFLSTTRDRGRRCCCQPTYRWGAWGSEVGASLLEAIQMLRDGAKAKLRQFAPEACMSLSQDALSIAQMKF